MTTTKTGTRIIELSNDKHSIQVEIVNYYLAAEGIRLTIKNEHKKNVYSSLDDQDIYFKELTAGIKTAVILVTEFDSYNLI